MKTPLVSTAHVLALLALAAGCGSKPSPPGRLENVGGSSGREPDASMPSGGSGGSAEPVLDAGPPDATTAPDADTLDAGPDARATPPDAAPAEEEEGCVVGTLEERCNELDCPDIDEAADWLLADDPVAVVRRPCEGADGTAFITIGGAYGLTSTGYIYDAASGELVSTYVVSDVPDYCSGGDASNVGFHGRVIPECASVNPNDTTTPCDDGPGNGGPGNGGPGNGGDPSEECIYING